MDYKLKGDERFMLAGKPTDMDVLDFWRFRYCERFDLQDAIAEYIVAKALGINEAGNTIMWTLYDILYRDARIEVKETSYYHAWQKDEDPKSEARVFSIGKAYSSYKDSTSTLARQNDIYIFCLNTGKTKEESDPLVLEHWEFYVIPTATINRECGDGKTIRLGRLKKLVKPVGYSEIKPTVDRIIDDLKLSK